MRSVLLEPGESLPYWHKFTHDENLAFTCQMWVNGHQIAFEYFERERDPFDEVDDEVDDDNYFDPSNYDDYSYGRTYWNTRSD